MSNAEKKALICGAGIGGMAAALALANRGIDVEVFERSAELGEVGAGIQLSPNAMHVLDALGLAEPILTAGFQPERSTIRHHSTGMPYVDIPLKQMCQRRFGAPYVHIHRADLLRTLEKAVRKKNIRIHVNAGLMSYVQDSEKVTVETAHGSHSGDFLIGADGLRSTIREQMHGKQRPDFTGQVAWRGTVPASDIPTDLILPDATVWSGPNRHFVSYLVRSGELINFVAVQERGDWTSESWSETGDIAEFRLAFQGWHAPVQAILEAATTCNLWALYDRQPLSSWVDGRAALLGDAAHPMLPFMAQGAAMAIEDAWVLADCLSSPASSPLENYEMIRKPRATMLRGISRQNAKLFHRRNSPFDLWQRAKLSAARIAPYLAVRQLDRIYGYDVTQAIK